MQQTRKHALSGAIIATKEIEMNDEHGDELDFFRGLVFAVPAGLAIWAVVFSVLGWV